MITVEQTTAIGPDDDRRTAIEEFLRHVRDRYRDASDAEHRLRAIQREDLDFLDPYRHWDLKARQERLLDGRPCLSVDRITPFLRQISNQHRLLRPRIQVRPVDDRADPQTAKIFQALIRHIEEQSAASVAYQTASFFQIAIGRGWIRVVSEWERPDSFAQILKIRRVDNPFAILTDPASRELDGSDMRYAFVVDAMPREVFIARFGRDAADRASQFAQTPVGRSWLVGPHMIQVVEYWYLDEVPDELIRIVPDTATPDTMPEPMALYASMWPPEGFPGFREVSRRSTFRTEVRSALITATDILDGDETGTRGRLWPTRRLHRIPIVPVLGEELLTSTGERDLRGVIRHAKDPQRAYDYFVSAMTEAIALAPRAPYIGYEGQFEGHEAKWRQLHRRNFPYLEVRPKSLGGQVLPLPQRQIAEPAIASIMAGLRQADYDLKAVMGLYEPIMASQGASRTSARALSQMQRQSEMGVSHFFDNLVSAIRAVGQILVDLIPAIYEEPRLLRIAGEAPGPILVYASQPGQPTPAPPSPTPDISAVYDMGVGVYDVVVSVGQVQDTRRQEMAAQLGQLLQAYPAAFPILGDLLVGSLDWEGADEAARRLRAMVPPHVTGAPDLSTWPPEMAAVVQQLQQQVMALGQENEQLKQQQATQITQAQAMLMAQKQAAESRERIAELKAQTEAFNQDARLAHDRRLRRLEREIDALQAQLALLKAGVRPDAGEPVTPTMRPTETEGYPAG